jgi:general secretion pathway protein G
MKSGPDRSFPIFPAGKMGNDRSGPDFPKGGATGMSRNTRLWFVIGIAIIAILLIAFPQYKAMIVKSRESTLETNLSSMREVIKQYTKDKQSPPKSLQALVDAGYFRELPIDPITNSNSSWQPVTESVAGGPAVTDVHSGATGTSTKGTAYSTW